MMMKKEIIATATAAVLLAGCGSGASVGMTRIADADQAAAPDSQYQGATMPDIDDVQAEPAAQYQASDVTFRYWDNSIGGKSYLAYVSVTNTGSGNLYLGSCTFDLEDDSGHLLQSDDTYMSFPDLIAPGETGYFVSGLSGINYIDEGVSLDGGINCKPSYNVEASTGQIVDYQVFDTSLSHDSYWTKAVGRATNDTDEDALLPSLYAIWRDESGNILGFSSTVLTDFNAGTTASFEITGPSLPDDAAPIDHFDIVARKDHFQF